MMALGSNTKAGGSKVQLKTFLVLNLTGFCVVLYYVNHLHLSPGPPHKEESVNLEKGKLLLATHITQKKQQQSLQSRTESAQEKGKPIKDTNITDKKQQQSFAQVNEKPSKYIITEKKQPQTPQTMSPKEKANQARWFHNVLAWKSNVTSRQPFWQQVDPDYRALVYSAHYDDVSYPPMVRVVGMYHFKEKAANASCLFYGPEGRPTRLSAGKIDRFRGYNSRRLRSEDPHWRWNLTRCFKSIQKQFNDHRLMAEMVASSIAVGVDHFVFYLQNASPQVKALLEVLVERGLAEVHPWNMDIADHYLYYSGQFPGHADCMYRHLWSSRYIFGERDRLRVSGPYLSKKSVHLFGDLDEIAVPRYTTSLLPLIDEGFRKDESCACLLIMHSFFNKFYTTERPPPEVLGTSGRSLTANLTMLTHTLREKRVYGPEQKSKYILDPHKTLTPSVHIIEAARTGFQMCDTNKTEVLLHHYRYWEPVSNDTVRDASVWAFAKQMISTYDSLMDSFKHKIT